MEKRDKLRVAYLIIGLILSLIGWWGFIYFTGWKISLFLFIIFWANNIANSDTFKNKK